MTGNVLLTGGAGYIGSHAAAWLLEKGWGVVVVDDFSNSSPVALERLAEIVPGADLRWHELDIRETGRLTEILRSEGVEAVVHFAGLKAVGESVERPLAYYSANVGGSVSLLQAMDAAGVRRIVFSSSCTVYGEPETLPLTEEHPRRRASSPYGRTKQMVEDVIEDVTRSDPAWRAISLRYFNPVGAHPSGRIGEDPAGIPNNLMPYVMQVAVGRRPFVAVYGDDYPTPDGTGVRDYIHVVDLAAAHEAALTALDDRTGYRALNVGTGKGHSVLEVIEAASRATGTPIPYKVVERRPGDVAATWADPSRAREELGWQAERDLDAMVADHWRWQSANPYGYAPPPSDQA
ncbi:MAG TPA: UDP-glucose 4-epimerase GalE [Acidimicrobiales bacterium]